MKKLKYLALALFLGLIFLSGCNETTTSTTEETTTEQTTTEEVDNRTVMSVVVNQTQKIEDGMVDMQGYRLRSFFSLNSALAYLRNDPSYTDDAIKRIYVIDSTYLDYSVIDMPNVELIGETDYGTIMTYNNSASAINLSTIELFGVSGAATIRLTENADNFIAKNITFVNTFDISSIDEEYREGYDASAPAISIASDNAIFYNCSFQATNKTIYTEAGRAYFYGCHVYGQNDLVTGNTGVAYFNNSVIESKAPDDILDQGYITCENGNGEIGYIFVDCSLLFDTEEPIGFYENSVYLGRPKDENASVAFINCFMDNHINEDGWIVNDEILLTNTNFYEVGTYGPAKTIKTQSKSLDNEAKNSLLNVSLVYDSFALIERFEKDIHIIAKDLKDDFVKSKQIRVAEAKQALAFPVDLEMVTKSFDLNYFGVNGTTITWSSSHPDVVNTQGVVVQPDDNDISVTLTATIKYKDVVDIKTFTFTVFAYEEYIPVTRLVEDFNYPDDTSLDSVDNWVQSGAKNTGIITSDVAINDLITINENTYKAIGFTSSASNDAKFTIKINAIGQMALEYYVMQSVEGASLGIEFLDGTAKTLAFKVGVATKDIVGINYFTNNGIATTETLDTGVWYKVRVEFNNDTKEYTYSYYEFGTDNLNLIASGTYVTSIETVQLRVVAGRNDAGSKTYLSHLDIGTASIELPVSVAQNPNRDKGIGTIEGFDQTVIHDQNTAFALPTFTIYNRFNKLETFSQGVDFNVSVLYYINEDGVLTEDFMVHTTTECTYNLYYTITLIEGTTTLETIELMQEVYIQNPDNPIYINDFYQSVITEDWITFTAKLSRYDGIIYYVIVPFGSTAPTINQIIGGISYGSVVVNASGTYDASSSGVDMEISLTLDSSDDKAYTAYFISRKQKANTLYVYAGETINNPIISSKITDTILITNCNEFYDMATNPDLSNARYKLDSDLDFATFDWANVSDVHFTGILDGNNHVISNLTIGSTSGIVKDTGIFGFIEGSAVIKNLHFVNASLTGAEEVGLLAGKCESGTFENISVYNLTINATQRAGGLLGYTSSANEVIFRNISLEDVYIRNSSKYSGLLFSMSENNIITMYDIYTKGTIDLTTSSGGDAAGGIIGRVKGGSVYMERVYSDFEVIDFYKQTGAFIGFIEQFASVTLINGVCRYVGLFTSKTISSTNIKTLGNTFGTVSDGSILTTETMYVLSSSLYTSSTSPYIQGVTKLFDLPNAELYHQQVQFDMENIWYFDIDSASPKLRYGVL